MNKNKLTRQQKEAVFLLSIGTFLEYFDLMLYIHMAVLLNELFFPQADPLVAKLLAAFAFCSTYLFRPIGGFIIGWIGDHVGRKNTIVITTFTMAACCLAMTSVGTYAEIGITATAVVIICRMLQGFSSMGEAVGADLYLVETLKQPYSYIGIGIIDLSVRFGTLFALFIASFSLSTNLNWRFAFLVGTGIALIGFAARRRLRETPEFVDFKRRMAKRKELLLNIPESHNKHAILPLNTTKPDKKTISSYFLMQVAGSVYAYIAYIYAGTFMKESMGMTPEEIINQNLKVTVFVIIITFIMVFFVKKYHPLKIARIQIMSLAIFLPFIPYWMSNISGLTSLTLLQLIILCVNPLIEAPCYKHIPIAGRFTIMATTFGVATALANVVVTFSLIPLTTYFGYYGLWVILVPATIGALLAVHRIRKLEIKAGLYHNYPDVTYKDDGLDAIEDAPEHYELPEEYEAYNLNCDYAQALLNTVSNGIEHGRKVNLNLIKKAIIFAKKWHDGQVRKTGEPYYSHPLAVARNASEYGMSTNAIIASILHDTVEDTACTVLLIEKEFNSRIAEIVQRLTRIVKDEHNNEIKLSVEEIMINLVKTNDTEAMLIKELDRQHNLETATGLKQEKQRECAQETLESIIQHVAHAVDKLHINNKLHLEDKMYDRCKAILASYMKNISIVH